MTYNEKIAYNNALADVYRRTMPDDLIETVVTELKKTVKGFHLTDKTMIAECPNCGNSWRGLCHLEQYKTYFESEGTPLTDAELQELVKANHLNTHSSLLFHVVEADKYVCPFCASVFELENT